MRFLVHQPLVILGEIRFLVRRIGAGRVEIGQVRDLDTLHETLVFFHDQGYESADILSPIHIGQDSAPAPDPLPFPGEFHIVETAIVPSINLAQTAGGFIFFLQEFPPFVERGFGIIIGVYFMTGIRINAFIQYLHGDDRTRRVLVWFEDLPGDRLQPDLDVF